MKRRSIACWPARITASGGASIGSMRHDMPIPMAIASMRRESMWKYRDWVIDAINQDMPFDQFAIEQIAGDMLPNATIDQKIATGFHRNTQINQEGGIDEEQFRVEAIIDRVNTTGSVFLGSDHWMRPVPQPQVRSDFADRLLPLFRFLQSVAMSRKLRTPVEDHQTAEPKFAISIPRWRCRRSRRFELASRRRGVGIER